MGVEVMIMTGQKISCKEIIFITVIFFVTYFKLGSTMPIENTYAAG